MLLSPAMGAATRLFRDRDGRIVWMQPPNLPLIAWFVFLLVERFTSGTVETVAALMSFGALFTWAWLELFEGVTPFRRLLGLGVLVIAIWNRL